MTILSANPPSPVRAHVRGLVDIVGRFTTAGTGVPVKVSPAVGYTVARTGVGTYVVTLSVAYKKILHATAHIIGAAGNTLGAKVIGTTDGGIRVGATITIELQSTAGTAADQTGLDVTFDAKAAQRK